MPSCRGLYYPPQLAHSRCSHFHYCTCLRTKQWCIWPSPMPSCRGIYYPPQLAQSMMIFLWILSVCHSDGMEILTTIPYYFLPHQRWWIPWGRMVLVVPHSCNCTPMLTMARWHEQDLVGGNLVHHEKNIIVRRTWLIGTWYWKRGGLLKKATVHPMIWNFDTSTPCYEYGYSLRLGSCEDHTSTYNTIHLSTKIWVEYSPICHLCALVI